MAYAERVPSPRGDYWRGRYKDSDGSWLTVRDDDGHVIRFALKQDAEDAAEDSQSDVRNGRARKPASEKTFAEWAEEWYGGLNLAWSTMAGRRRHLDDHLLDHFGAVRLADIDEAMIGRWEMKERRKGKKPASIATWRGTLHTCLEDAVPKLISQNPARRKGNRGKRADKGRGRGPEKPFTDALGALLISERMSILTGRDQEFAMGLTSFWGALRLGELVGLERQYLRPEGLRVEWQLHQLDLQGAAQEGEILAAMRAEAPGGLLRCPPKDNSFGDVILAPFMVAMLAGFAASWPARPCPCHGFAYLFRGFGVPSGGGPVPEGTVTLADVAAIASVSPTTVRKALSGAGGVSEAVRRCVAETAAAVGFARRGPSADPAWHWRRSAFEGLVKAAATGELPPGGSRLPRRPVPLGGEWPGTRLRGPGAIGRATVRWEPVATGLTPHLLARHSMRTLMEEKRIPHIMSETHLRHDIPGVSGAYRHVTDNMRDELAAMMTAEHESALDARLGMSPRSPVAVLDAMLLERADARKIKAVSRISPESTDRPLSFPVSTTGELWRNGRA